MKLTFADGASFELEAKNATSVVILGEKYASPFTPYFMYSICNEIERVSNGYKPAHLVPQRFVFSCLKINGGWWFPKVKNNGS